MAAVGEWVHRGRRWVNQQSTEGLGPSDQSGRIRPALNTRCSIALTVRCSGKSGKGIQAGSPSPSAPAICAACSASLDRSSATSLDASAAHAPAPLLLPGPAAAPPSCEPPSESALSPGPPFAAASPPAECNEVESKSSRWCLEDWWDDGGTGPNAPAAEAAAAAVAVSGDEPLNRFEAGGGPPPPRCWWWWPELCAAAPDVFKALTSASNWSILSFAESSSPMRSFAARAERAPARVASGRSPEEAVTEALRDALTAGRRCERLAPTLSSEEDESGPGRSGDDGRAGVAAPSAPSAQSALRCPSAASFLPAASCPGAAPAAARAAGSPARAAAAAVAAAAAAVNGGAVRSPSALRFDDSSPRPALLTRSGLSGGGIAAASAAASLTTEIDIRNIQSGGAGSTEVSPEG